MSGRTVCTVCDHSPTVAKGLCHRCYQRARRGAEPSATHRRAADGEGERISVRMSRDLRARVEIAARVHGSTPPEFIRALLNHALDPEHV